MIKGIVGLQFGDEGKGKATDYFATDIDNIIRFSGGVNAGHTVVANEVIYKFSQLPAVARNNKNLFLTHAVLIEPETLIHELNIIKSFNNINLFIDYRAHLVLPIHRILNKSSEEYRGSRKIGSVGKGIGASYEDKINRVGIRIIDIFNEKKLLEKLEFLYTLRSHQINKVFGSCYNDVQADIILTYELLIKLSRQIKNHVCYTNDEIILRLKNNQKFLLEGSQATFLDNGLGSYPYTVAYPTLMTSCFYNMGIPVQKNFHVIGVMKAYTIRVGEGPFPTELFDEKADILRRLGNEYGTVSGRKRRCGWLDLNIVKYSVELNGVDEVMITNVDVLSAFKTFKVCYQYEKNGKVLTSLQEGCSDLSSVTPVYKELEGWEFDEEKIASGELPKALLYFINFIEDFIGVPVSTISYGRDREKTLNIKNIKNRNLYCEMAVNM